MDNDVSAVRFSRNHRQDSAAREALLGLRWLLAALAIYAALVVLVIAETVAARTIGMQLVDAWRWFSLLIWLTACAVGAYGIHRMADSMGWAEWLTVAFILIVLIPYVGLLALATIAGFAINLIRNAGYRITLFGPIQRNGPPALPE